MYNLPMASCLKPDTGAMFVALCGIEKGWCTLEYELVVIWKSRSVILTVLIVITSSPARKFNETFAHMPISSRLTGSLVI